MKIKAIQCGSCSDTVYSRANEDYRECTCGCAGTFGGQAYTKYSLRGNHPHKKIIINLDTTGDKLYNDWKDMLDVYGLIEATPSTSRTRQAY